ncbi:MAG: DUF4367 domain-containing protein [Bacillota bacterium]|nr:DUF4367 domain-containing protein [Bacillota bacterium]
MKNEFDYLNDVKMDLSEYEIADLTDLERSKMKNIIKKTRKIKIGKIAGIAACVAVVAAFSQTAFAQNLIDNIVKSISTGHNQFLQVDDSKAVNLPDELVGLVFDKNGNSVTSYQKDTQYYDKDGNKITDFETFIRENIDVTKIETEDGSVKVTFSDKTTDPLKEAKGEGYPVIDDEKAINDNLSFKSKMPTYLPEGFSFYGGVPMGKDYLFVYYKNQDTGKWFVVHERIINENTAFGYATDGTIEETKINGNKAVISDGRSIDWECDDISIAVQGRGEISKEDLFKVAKSIK